MSVTIEIPGSMRRFTANQACVEVEGGDTVMDALQHLVERHPGMRNVLFTPSGQVFAYVGIFLNQRDVRHLEREASRVGPGDSITLLPATAGG
jgi:molybdopterin converting factor small subunit